jgi:hypothetical protein
MPLQDLQIATGNVGKLSAIAISGAGGVHEGYKHSDAIKESLRPDLTGSGLGVDMAKSLAVEDGERIAQAEEYTSHNTERLDVAGLVKMLIQLDYIQEALKS